MYYFPLCGDLFVFHYLFIFFSIFFTTDGHEIVLFALDAELLHDIAIRIIELALLYKR